MESRWRSQPVTFEQLCGRSSTHLVTPDELRGHQLTPATVAAFGELSAQASEAGIQLAIASSFRSFARQLAIWNAKAEGLRPVFANDGQLVELDSLDGCEQVFAILRWWALPGVSRHHWGTDIDVYDASAMTPDYQLQLIPEEYAPGGVFARLGQWLNQSMAAGPSCGFFRPYARDLGGVAVEPWHLSCQPEVGRFEQCLDSRQYRDFIAGQSIALKPWILDNIDEIYQRFVLPYCS